MVYSVHDRRKVIWGVVDDHVVEDATDLEDMRLQGFGFTLFNKYNKG